MDEKNGDLRKESLEMLHVAESINSQHLMEGKDNLRYVVHFDFSFSSSFFSSLSLSIPFAHDGAGRLNADIAFLMCCILSEK